MLVVRTRKAFWRSRPSALLVWLTLAVALFAVGMPYLPGADWFGFVPLPWSVMAGLAAITPRLSRSLGGNEALVLRG